MVHIQLPDGSIKQVDESFSPLDVAMGIGPRLAKACLAAVVDGAVVDASRPLRESLPPEKGQSADAPVALRLLTDRDPEALAVMRHSAAHVMARAVMRLFPGVGLAFGPTLPNGFYYDFDMAGSIREEDFPRIEQEMAQIIAEAEPFERFELPRDQALALCGELGQHLKVEHITTGLAGHATLSFYRQGEFVDLCRGPHIPDAGRIKAFKLLSVAAAHFKGEAGGKALTRLYGTAFFSQKELEQYLSGIEEAKRRDHRLLGRQHGLFHVTNDVGPGLCLWLPKGAMVRGLLEEFIKRELIERGYQPVYSPHIGRVELYETSGHFPYYRDSQFAPIFGHPAGALVDRWISLLESGELSSEVERKFLEIVPHLQAAMPGYPLLGPREDRLAALRTWQSQHERYLLKPMNCPHHVQIYKSEQRSYRELPVRLAEFGTVYRHEQSGELNGMLRVRGLTQDDAHQFCTPEQVEEEFRETLLLVQFVLSALGLEDYRVQLSLRDPRSSKYVGSEENWRRAEASLRGVLEDLKLPFEPRLGEAAFYGPKADFMVRDCLGREWQLGTVQLDYNLPERFELEYIGADNRPHRPVMIHRAPFGSMERFVGVLIEHFAAAFPLWLAPEQARLLPISEKAADYAGGVERQLKAAGFRVTTDRRSAKINAKVRDAQLDLVPYMLVIGQKEADEGTVTVRDRLDPAHQRSLPVAQVIAEFTAEVRERRIRHKPAAAGAGWSSAAEVQHEY